MSDYYNHEGKVANIDFVLYDDEYEQLVFRFLPQKSYCHSFNEKPPTKWEEVYKVYYAYEIFRQYKNDEGEIDGDEDKYIVFECDFDECSIIDEVSARIKLIHEGKKSVTITNEEFNTTHTIKLLNEEIFPFGDGVTWIINKRKNPNYYNFTLWNRDGTGFRFDIEKEKMAEFGVYLNDCCEYMLQHGCPI